MTVALRKTATPYLRIEQLRRQSVEDFIDQLIGLLDDLDGDENLEPYLADTYPATEDREGAEDDPFRLETREGDASDYEPSCGWTPMEAASGHYADGLGDEEEEFVNEDGCWEAV